ncbi:hypothetical protein GGI17_003823 [Coemansia sp. S146]|nr:hypothetical protein GGI17_003823 [Coemansia sp. S146]
MANNAYGDIMRMINAMARDQGEIMVGLGNVNAIDRRVTALEGELQEIRRLLRGMGVGNTDDSTNDAVEVAGADDSTDDAEVDVELGPAFPVVSPQTRPTIMAEAERNQRRPRRRPNALLQANYSIAWLRYAMQCLESGWNPCERNYQQLHMVVQSFGLSPRA